MCRAIQWFPLIWWQSNKLSTSTSHFLPVTNCSGNSPLKVLLYISANSIVSLSCFSKSVTHDFTNHRSRNAIREEEYEDVDCMERLWNMSIDAAKCCKNENSYLKYVSHNSCEAHNQIKKTNRVTQTAVIFCWPHLSSHHYL